MKSYSLYKISYPSWLFKSYYLSEIRIELENHICDSCLLTEDFLSKNYDDFSDLEKIQLLLSTHCGLEYFLEPNIDLVYQDDDDYIW